MTVSAVQLKKMNLKDLRGLQQRIDGAIRDRQEQEKVKLKERMSALAAEAGFHLRDVIGLRKAFKGTHARKAGTVKYRHPRNPEWTWSGRGRRPNWLAKSSGNIERFRVS